MLETLSKQDKEWRKMAFIICKDKQLADDITNDMYINLHKYNASLDRIKDLNSYIFRVLKNEYNRYFKKEQTVHISELYYLKDNQNEFEPDDYQQEILDKFNTLEWGKQEYISESYDRSTRQIAEFYHINYGHIHREKTNGLKQIFGPEFETNYNNTRLKHLKK